MTSPVARALSAALALVLAQSLAARPAQAAGTLELTPDAVVTVTLLIVFILIIFPLNNMIFQPLLRVMDEREEKIDGARQKADRVVEQAQEALERYEEAIRVAHEEATADRRRKLDVARAEMHDVTSKAKADANRDITRAREELGASLEDARQTLRGNAEELAGLAAERILGRSLSS